MACPVEALKGQKNSNRRMVYRIIRELGAVTRSQLQRLTGIKATTLNRLLAEMVEQQLVTDAGLAESTGGRPSVLFSINPKVAYVIGIDISRTYTKAVLFDMDINAVESGTMLMTDKGTPQAVIEFLRSWLLQVIDKTGISSDNIIGAGVGTVGPLDRINGMVMQPKGFPASGWDLVPIKKLLENVLDMQVILANGADCGVSAEYKYGAGRGYSRVAYVIAGIGLRLGFIDSGRLSEGLDDDEISMAHMIVDVDGRLCSCGFRGCLNTYCTIPAIIAQCRYNQASSLSDICKALEKGDESIHNVVDEVAVRFGAALVNLVYLLNADRVILAGPLIKDCPIIYEKAVIEAERRIRSVLPKSDIFALGQLGDDAIAMGAAVMVINSLLRD